MIQETSLLAFKRIKKELPECRFLVYKTIKKLGYCTNSMIAKSLGWTINRVTPRTNELRKMNLIKISHASWCPITHGKANYMALLNKDDAYWGRKVS